MYLPTAFEEQRPEALHALMQAHPLGTLVTHGPDGLDANHIPFELDTAVGPHGLLRGHVARANPVGQEGGDSRRRWVFRGQCRPFASRGDAQNLMP